MPDKRGDTVITVTRYPSLGSSIVPELKVKKIMSEGCYCLQYCKQLPCERNCDTDPHRFPKGQIAAENIAHKKRTGYFCVSSVPAPSKC
nr:hypothetical protein BaRGS_021000 [Batillaria attramentaria]